VDCESDACISIGIVHRIWYYLYLPVELGAGATRECRGRVPGVCNRRGGGGGLVYWEDMAYHGHSLQGKSVLDQGSEGVGPLMFCSP
jgi:hypothetical protein